MTESQQPPSPAAPPPPPPQPPQSSRAKRSSGPLRPIIFIAIVFFGVMAVVMASKFYTPAERIPWRSDLPAALAEARAANKPVLLYFTADWCVPCQYMRRNVFPDSGVADAIAASYIPVRIDHDQRQDLIAAYQIDGIPWFGVLDASGKPTRILNRAVDTPEQFIAWLKG